MGARGAKSSQKVYVYPSPQTRKLQTRHNANESDDLIIKFQRSAKNIVTAAETLNPEFMTDGGDGRSITTIFASRDASATAAPRPERVMR
jgi:hypothetical protein